MSLWLQLFLLTLPVHAETNLFVLSWSPQYCSGGKAARDTGQCAGSRKFGFVVHGLWGEEGGHCGRGARVSEATINGMLDLMPSRGLIIHEWNEHGKCLEKDPVRFFSRIRSLFRSVKIPERFLGPRAEIEVSAAEIEKSFASANPAWPKDSVALHCRRRYFGEVRICVNGQDRVVSCPTQNKKTNCAAGTLIVRPLR
jgi:ribonuclease T2